MLPLPGWNPALIDTGFAGHAGHTADWVHARTGQLSLVLNTHWHADRVGGNGMLQARGAGIAATAADADAVARRGPGCCQAEYLDQPVARMPVPVAARRAAPHRDALSDYDVVSNDVETRRELPFRPVAGIRSALRIPDAAGAYRGVRATMEQTWADVTRDIGRARGAT